MQFDLASSTQRTGLTATSIDNDVKMVIWDLDDTFWNGTLAEGGIEFIESNAEIVRALAGRGIISSIASKNQHEAARDVLERAGLWDYFVFPSISFDPKGEKVAEIIRNASLRAENILFIDDNVSNLEEARFYNPGIMLAQPGEIIPHLLDHPRLTGKADPDLKRLNRRLPAPASRSSPAARAAACRTSRCGSSRAARTAKRASGNSMHASDQMAAHLVSSDASLDRRPARG